MIYFFLFFSQCETGQVKIGDFVYNIHFKITTEDICEDNIIIKIKNKDLFFKYIKEFLLLFDFDNEYVVLKKLVYLFSNLTFSDFNNIELYLKRNIEFVKNSLLQNKTISFLSSKLEIEIKSYNQESPYCFIAKITDGNYFYELPIISYGISEGVCYIFAVQDKNSDKTSDYSKKVKRLLYKINKGVYENENSEYIDFKENKSFYYPENISDVSPAAVLSLSLFLKEIYDMGIMKVKVVSFLPIRYNAKKQAYLKKLEYIINRENLDFAQAQIVKEKFMFEHLRIQNNLTQKLLRNFYRINYHFPNVKISATPFEEDEFLNIDLSDFLKKDDILNEMILGVEKKLK